MATYPAYGRLIRQARTETGLRRIDVAQKLDIHKEYYARLERGRALGAINTIAALRALLGFDANHLLATLGYRAKPVPPRVRVTIRHAAPVRGPHAGFGLLLKQQRMARGLTQLGVATAVDCTSQFYGHVESGQKLPSMKTFAKLHDCLGIDANELLDALIRAPRPFSAFGQLLGHTRESKQKTLAEVAEAIGVSLQRYSRMEAGAELPAIMVFVRLHRVLGFDANNAVKAIPIDPDVEPEEIWGPHYVFGQRVRQARMKRGMSLYDLAEAIRVTTRYCRCLEAGILLPSITKLAKLQDCLGFDTNPLLRVLIHTVRPFAEFGRLLADAREQLARTPSESAEAVGCERERYQRIESGVELPTTMMLVRLHEILGFDAYQALCTIPVGSNAEDLR